MKSSMKSSIQPVTFQELSSDLLNQLVKGAFLTVKHGEKINTMTIGWGTVGYIWNKPVLMVPVRYSRYTHSLIEQAESFTVSVPVNRNMKEALAFCGTKSGRDLDKIAACGLTLKDSQTGDTPIIGECDLHIECKIIYRQAMAPENLDEHIQKSQYNQGDFHVLYYGEIVSSYYTS